MLLGVTACSSGKSDSDNSNRDSTEKSDTKRSYDNETKDIAENASSDQLVASYTDDIDRAYYLMMVDEDIDGGMELLQSVEVNGNMSAETLSKAAVGHAIGLAYLMSEIDFDDDNAKEVYGAWLSDATDSYNMALVASEETLNQYEEVFSQHFDTNLRDFLDGANQLYTKYYGQ